MTPFVGLVARMGGFSDYVGDLLRSNLPKRAAHLIQVAGWPRCVGLVGEVLNFYERKRNLQRISLWVYEKFATYCDCFNYHSFYFL